MGNGFSSSPKGHSAAVLQPGGLDSALAPTCSYRGAALRQAGMSDFLRVSTYSDVGAMQPEVPGACCTSTAVLLKWTTTRWIVPAVAAAQLLAACCTPAADTSFGLGLMRQTHQCIRPDSLDTSVEAMKSSH